MAAMRELIKELIPHAPQIGLYVDPNLPPEKLRNAIGDYAKDVDEQEVVALFDATLMGSAKDGVVFTSDRLVFQNNDLEKTQNVRYEDVVDIQSRRKLLGGRRVVLTVNRGRATFELDIDFSGKPAAAEYVTRFLKEAMVRGELSRSAARAAEGSAPASGKPIPDPAVAGEAQHGDSTDHEAVEAALEELHASGRLSSRHLRALLDVLRRG